MVRRGLNRPSQISGCCFVRLSDQTLFTAVNQNKVFQQAKKGLHQRGNFKILENELINIPTYMLSNLLLNKSIGFL